MRPLARSRSRGRPPSASELAVGSASYREPARDRSVSGGHPYLPTRSISPVKRAAFHAKHYCFSAKVLLRQPGGFEGRKLGSPSWNNVVGNYIYPFSWILPVSVSEQLVPLYAPPGPLYSSSHWSIAFPPPAAPS